MKMIKQLLGSGERIGALVAPFLVVGLALNVWRPSMFSVGGPPTVLKVLAGIALAAGLVTWLWSVVLILTRVPKHELITEGPFSVVKHPLYTGVALLVVPSIGLLLNSWLGVLIGVVIYVGSRMFSPDEERALSETFGPAWDEYSMAVKIRWL